MNEYPPIVSESESERRTAAYDAWLREKVATSLADDRPSAPHDAAMTSIRELSSHRRRFSRWR